MFTKNDTMPGFIAPANSFPEKATIYTASLWMGGIDNNNNLHLAAQMYRTDTLADYWPGFLDNNGSIYEQDSYEWNRIWKVNYTQIHDHIEEYNQNTQNQFKNNDIFRWPGINNDDAKGYNNANIDARNSPAPFFDKDISGDYYPPYGEHPPIKGDQILWYVYNDNTYSQRETNALPLKADVATTAYAIASADTFLDNTVIIEYKIRYWGGYELSDFYIGLFTDFDIGCWDNDYLGCDTLSSTFFAYNSVYPENNCGGYEYENIKPVQLVTFLNEKMNGFSYFDHNYSLTGYPVTAMHYYNYMAGKWKDGTTFKRGGTGYGSGSSYRFAYDGNPADNNEWSQCALGNTAGEKKGLGVIGPMTMRPGQITTFAVAFTFVDYPGDYPCFDFETIRPKINDLKNKYANNLLVNEINIPSSVEDLNAGIFNLSPNPSSAKIKITTTLQGNNAVQYQIINTLGATAMVSKATAKDFSIDVSNLPSGIYFIHLQSGSAKTVKRFVKE
jgi:hypothetical protein